MPLYFTDMSEVTFWGCTEPRAWRFDSDRINDGIFIYSNTSLVWRNPQASFSPKKPKGLHLQTSRTLSVLLIHPQKSKTVSKFFIIFKFLVEWLAMFVDSDFPYAILESVMTVLECSWSFSLNSYCLIHFEVDYACFWYKNWAFGYTE